MDLEKPFSVLRKTMRWACQLFYQLLEKQILHFPVLPASNHLRFCTAEAILSKPGPSQHHTPPQGKGGSESVSCSPDTEAFYSTFSRPLKMLFPGIGRIPRHAHLGSTSTAGPPLLPSQAPEKTLSCQ